MNSKMIFHDLTAYSKTDEKFNKDKVIQAKKQFSSMKKESEQKTKLTKCYYCGKVCESFCNSHTLPAFCLKNIALDGKVFYMNTILNIPLLKDDKGINEAGTFHLICRDCDSKIFQDYENPDNYENKPSIKMLAQIDMKNNLKNISKRLIENHMYDIMPDKIGANAAVTQMKKDIGEIDLQEFNEAFRNAKRRSEKPFSGDYYIGYYAKLPYVVPVAFQGTIALISDLEKNTINDIYEADPQYKIMYMTLCIFPLKDASVVMLFTAKNNNRYRRFFKQLNKVKSLDEQLQIINYILFAYTEDYFLSNCISPDTIKQLEPVSRKSQEVRCYNGVTHDEIVEAAKERFDYDKRASIPNLLSKQFAVNINFD